jgi:hypothetical protein
MSGKAQNAIRNRRQQLDAAIDGTGLIEGPGTPTSDSIPIRASAGERIIPADVESQFGPVLEAIVRMFHTPVAGGK